MRLVVVFRLLRNPKKSSTQLTNTGWVELVKSSGKESSEAVAETRAALILAEILNSMSSWIFPVWTWSDDSPPYSMWNNRALLYISTDFTSPYTSPHYPLNTSERRVTWMSTFYNFGNTKSNLIILSIIIYSILSVEQSSLWRLFVSLPPEKSVSGLWEKTTWKYIELWMTQSTWHIRNSSDRHKTWIIMKKECGNCLMRRTTQTENKSSKHE